MEDRPRISLILNSLANYSNTIPAPADPDAKPAAGGARMGTLIGVYLPCIQNIFGVILFIRLTWVVGTAGAIAGFLIVFCCCCVVSFFFATLRVICANNFVFSSASLNSQTRLFFTDNANCHLDERYCHEWSGTWWRVLLYDIKIFGTWVWWGGWYAVLYRYHSCSCHVHYWCCGNSHCKYQK